ncbi:MAG TPA: hypothetical protein VF897_20090 [Roseiflexaceae bacterium]
MTLRFNKRAVRDRLTTAARGVVNDLSSAVAVLVLVDAPRNTEFLAESVEAIPIGGRGRVARREERVDRAGRRVVRVSNEAPALPPDTAALHVGADYALEVDQQTPFIWPKVEQAQQELPGIVAKRRI